MKSDVTITIKSAPATHAKAPNVSWLWEMNYRGEKIAGKVEGMPTLQDAAQSACDQYASLHQRDRNARRKANAQASVSDAV